MENNINKYLHKKFKKQFGEIRSSNHHHYQQNSIESNGIVNTTRENIKEEEKKSSTNVNSTIQDEEQQQHQNQSKRGSDSIATTIDNNNSNSSGSGSSCNVPNESSSTNNNNNLLLCTVNSNEKSSISSPLSTVTATTTTTTVALPAASSLSSSSTLDTTLPTGTAVTVVSSASTNVIKVNVIKKNEQSHHHHLNSDELKDEGSNSATNDARRTLCSEIIADSTAAAIKEPQTKNGSISSIFSKVEGQIINDKSNDINFDTNFKSTEPKHAKSSTTTTTALQDNERTITIITTAAGATATTTTTTAHHVVAQKENNLIPYYVNATTTVEDVSVGAIGTYDALKLKYVSMVNETNQIAEKSASGKYVCSYCNLVCSKPSVLQKHIRAHTNERPYPCESCGSRFKTRSNLYKHCRSRTHANRVMGNNNKSSTTTASENNNDADNVDNQMKYDYYNGSSKMTIGEMNEMNVRNSCKIDNSQMAKENSQQQEQQQQQMQQSVTIDAKPKPYKPRFHTKSFYDNLTKENAQQEDQTCAKPINSTSSSSVLMSRADEPIARIRHAIKNNYYTANNNGENNNNNNKPSSNHAEPYHDEPLNLSSKSRKRCLSEVAEPTTQKSLIKELLLKNLYASADMQCPNCKMIFQTVTELDVHKHRSNCKGYSKTGARYNRSSSVNVASILTQNKNAFDGIPQLQEAFFPLKSPGPFLGKTRLIESDKSKSFSFDDGIQNTQNDFFRGGGVVGNYKNLSSIDVSPKRPAPVKLFGGEVKITHASGETKSFIVDGKESSDGCFMAGGNAGGDYNAKLSENTVVKSVLQSGGTVLQNKTGYNSGSSSCTNNNKKQLLSPVDALNYHHAKPVSPNYHAETGNKYATANEIGSNNINVETHISTEYTSIVDFSQKAVKSFTPNLKQLNLTIPGVPVPNILPQSSTLTDPCAEAQIVSVIGKQHDQREKPIEIAKDFRLRNPMTLLVNGKFVPYVPGMPGPITAEVHLDSLYHNGLQHQQTVPIPTFKLTPPEQSEELLAGGRAAIVQNNTYAKQGASEHKTTVIDQHHQSVPMVVVSQQVPMDVTQSPTATDKLLMVDTSSSSPKKIAKPSTSPLATTTVQQQETPKRFARPNSLALKPTMASMKQHHGLTPTVFNQILISPDTPRVAKKYIEYQRNGYYFSSLGLKSSTKSVYCTLNKTQPYYVPHYKKLSMYSEWRQQDTKTDKLYVSVYDSRQRPQKYTLAGQICQPHVVHSSYKFIVSRSYGNDDGNKVNQQIAGGHESNENYTYVRGRDESTRQHEAAYGLLSLSQKPSRVDFRVSTPNDNNNIFSLATATTSKDSVNSIMDNEEIVHVSKQTFAKNKILDQEPESFSRKFSIITPVPDDNDPTITTCNMNSRTSVEYCTDAKMVNLYLGKSNVNRPLTYPYTSPLIIANPPIVDVTDKTKEYEKENYASTDHDNRRIDDDDEDDVDDNDERMTYESSCDDPKEYVTLERRNVIMSEEVSPSKRDGHKKMNYVFASTTTDNNVYDDHRHRTKRQQKQDDAMDLSVNSSSNKENGDIEMMELETDEAINYSKTYPTIEKIGNGEQYDLPLRSHYSHHYQSHEANDSYPKPTVTRVILQNGVDANYTSEDSSNDMSVKIYKRIGSDYDNSAMETLADIATKQMKLERNSVAKNVATEFLKLATKNDGTVLDSLDSSNFIKSSKDVNDLIAKREENKSCTICLKNFNKPSQLRLHMNIHYLERPFRCDSCSVGFRTKGLLQKHERSAGHHNKLSTSPALSSSEPRPFKCGDCSVAFRIHGHLAKHLRSKMHIMKLECLAKIPFGLYAELERSNSLLTEINTSDGEQCLESLKSLAKKVFDNDPNKLNQSKEDRRVSYE